MSFITLKIYQKNSDNEYEYLKDYKVNINSKIIDMKTKILIDLFDNKYNYLEFENITERVYKDYGKLFFDLGPLPNTLDNYIFEQMTNGERTFSFNVIPMNIDKKEILPIKKSGNEILNKVIRESREIKKMDEGFVLYDDDFPPLR